jgi:lysyl-tRNA synthetase class 1
MIKGGAGKMSSSSGNLYTLSEVLEVYDPQIVRWIFASHRPNHDFSIAFDEDVIKIHDEFDRAEQMALGPRPEKDGKWPLVRRTYELSTLDGCVPQRQPLRPGFRVLCNQLQICDGDIGRTLERYYQSQIRDDNDRQAFQVRAQCAKNWLEKHAPEEFKYKINSQAVNSLVMSQPQADSIVALRCLLERVDLTSIDPKDLNQMIYDDVIRGTPCEAGEFFLAVYQKLIGRDQGPRLPGFLKEIGKDRLLSLL